MTDEVVKAADELIAAFSEGRMDDYFKAFAPDATFVFHTTPRRIESVADYRRVWTEWVTMHGLQVLNCVSTDRMVQRWDGAAVFTHCVETLVETHEGAEMQFERETIVFRRGEGGRWWAVHEHLLPAVRLGPAATG